MNDEIKFFPLGESALIVDFGGVISSVVNERVLRLYHYFERTKFDGINELFPAYSSLTIFYDPIRVRKLFPRFSTAFEFVKNLVLKAVDENLQNSPIEPRLLEIPVNFDEQFAVDLSLVAQVNGLSAETVIEIFTRRIYTVFMLGFLPGFAYMGEVDAEIAAPRRNSPRLNVPAGSVGIAGRQTGIYPFDSPGGWQIIGKTDIKLFDEANNPPTFFRAGDSVKFYQI